MVNNFYFQGSISHKLFAGSHPVELFLPRALLRKQNFSKRCTASLFKLISNTIFFQGPCYASKTFLTKYKLYDGPDALIVKTLIAVQIKNDALRAYFLNKRETLIGVPARGWQKLLLLNLLLLNSF
jgi:hypothetical protein